MTSPQIRKLTTSVAVVLGVAIIIVGVRFVLEPGAAATNFGVPARPDDPAFLAAKGLRDIVTGLAGLTLIALGYRRAAGWLLAVIALIPIGDAVIVAQFGGSMAYALVVHGATAAVLLAVAVALAKQDDPFSV
jgi:hypothetical protein